MLCFDYDKDGIVYNTGLLFKKVRAHRHTAELHCSYSKISESYDTLIQISGSRWVEELLASTVEDKRNSWQLNHYMIYFDSDGCYEVIAESWEALPEKQGSLSD